MPRVSVLMPVYNTKPEHLREAMDSILSQTFTDFEFLILNDSSPNADVEETVKSYDDPRIVYARNERNLGISGARNRLLDMAQGEYLAVMDHDDISLPERFEKQVAFLDAHPSVGVVRCQIWNCVSHRDRRLPIKNVDIKKNMMFSCAFCHPAIMMRASVLKAHELCYEEFFSPAEDYALFCRLVKHTDFANLPEVLFHYRDWEGNTSHKQDAAMASATLGIEYFVRKENPEIWAMAQYHMKTSEHIKILGIPFFLITRTHRFEEWKLFDVIPIFKRKYRPVGSSF